MAGEDKKIGVPFWPNVLDPFKRLFPPNQESGKASVIQEKPSLYALAAAEPDIIKAGKRSSASRFPYITPETLIDVAAPREIEELDQKEISRRLDRLDELAEKLPPSLLEENELMGKIYVAARTLRYIVDEGICYTQKDLDCSTDLQIVERELWYNSLYFIWKGTDYILAQDPSLDPLKLRISLLSPERRPSDSSTISVLKTLPIEDRLILADAVKHFENLPIRMEEYTLDETFSALAAIEEATMLIETVSEIEDVAEEYSVKERVIDGKRYKVIGKIFWDVRGYKQELKATEKMINKKKKEIEEAEARYFKASAALAQAIFFHEEHTSEVIEESIKITGAKYEFEVLKVKKERLQIEIMEAKENNKYFGAQRELLELALIKSFDLLERGMDPADFFEILHAQGILSNSTVRELATTSGKEIDTQKIVDRKDDWLDELAKVAAELKRREIVDKIDKVLTEAVDGEMEISRQISVRLKAYKKEHDGKDPERDMLYQWRKEERVLLADRKKRWLKIAADYWAKKSPQEVTTIPEIAERFEGVETFADFMASSVEHYQAQENKYTSYATLSRTVHLLWLIGDNTDPDISLKRPTAIDELVPYMSDTEGKGGDIGYIRWLFRSVHEKLPSGLSVQLPYTSAMARAVFDREDLMLPDTPDQLVESITKLGGNANAVFGMIDFDETITTITTTAQFAAGAVFGIWLGSLTAPFLVRNILTPLGMTTLSGGFSGGLLGLAGRFILLVNNAGTFNLGSEVASYPYVGLRTIKDYTIDLAESTGIFAGLGVIGKITGLVTGYSSKVGEAVIKSFEAERPIALSSQASARARVWHDFRLRAAVRATFGYHSMWHSFVHFAMTVYYLDKSHLALSKIRLDRPTTGSDGSHLEDQVRSAISLGLIILGSRSVIRPSGRINLREKDIKRMLGREYDKFKEFLGVRGDLYDYWKTAAEENYGRYDPLLRLTELYELTSKGLYPTAERISEMTKLMRSKGNYRTAREAAKDGRVPVEIESRTVEELLGKTYERELELIEAMYIFTQLGKINERGEVVIEGQLLDNFVRLKNEFNHKYRGEVSLKRTGPNEYRFVRRDGGLLYGEVGLTFKIGKLPASMHEGYVPLFKERTRPYADFEMLVSFGEIHPDGIVYIKPESQKYFFDGIEKFNDSFGPHLQIKPCRPGEWAVVDKKGRPVRERYYNHRGEMSVRPRELKFRIDDTPKKSDDKM